MKRLINCDFINDSKFKVELSNKAKLLYLYMLTIADPVGFVGQSKELVETLSKNDRDFHNEASLDLIEQTYDDALHELIDKGFIYEFVNKYQGTTHLIRHWYFHNNNKTLRNVYTNYSSYLKKVELLDNEYVWRVGKGENQRGERIRGEVRRDRDREDSIYSIQKDNLPTSKDRYTHEDMEEEINENEDNNYSLEDYLRDKGVSCANELSADEIEEWLRIKYGKKEN